MLVKMNDLIEILRGGEFCVKSVSPGTSVHVDGRNAEVSDENSVWDAETRTLYATEQNMKEMLA